jgi:hypothetical protein
MQSPRSSVRRTSHNPWLSAAMVIVIAIAADSYLDSQAFQTRILVPLGSLFLFGLLWFATRRINRLLGSRNQPIAAPESASALYVRLHRAPGPAAPRIRPRSPLHSKTLHQGGADG